ncbi:hypothetical protein FJZ36_00710 [Candidatus Poribacteria bacterium]|nr:hypothetical protein [Candidatus Poribacteria bacterium]
MTRGVRLVGIDIDGTLLDPSGRITDATHRALDRAHRLGIEIAIVSGRRFESAMAVAGDLYVPALYGLHNGAALRRRDGSYLYARRVSEDIIHAAGRLADELDAYPLAFQDDSGDPFTRIFCMAPERADESLAPYFRDYVQRNAAYVTLVDDLTGFSGNALEVMLTAPKARTGELAGAVAERLGSRVSVIPAHGGRIGYIGIAHHDVTKALPLQQIAAERGLTADEIMAVGDNLNDLDMLRYAGHGVLMGNAAPELHRLGFRITGGNDEDGLAAALNDLA